MEFKKFRVVLKDFTYYTIQAENLKNAWDLALKKHSRKEIYSIYWWVGYE